MAERRAVDGLRELEQKVGQTTLVGKVVVNQPYAQHQHENLRFRHRSGGRAKYLAKPLMQSRNRYLQGLAGAVLEGRLEAEMAQVVEDLSAAVYANAPLEFGDLKASAHPTVHAGSTKKYDRPPGKKRLTKEELRVKWRLRELGLGNRRGG